MWRREPHLLPPVIAHINPNLTSPSHDLKESMLHLVMWEETW